MPTSRRAFLALAPLLPTALRARTESSAPARSTPLSALADDSIPRARARDLGVRIGRLTPGPSNAITDVAGVEVGHTTLVSGSGPLVVGRGPVRTGVTAIWPHRGIQEELLPCAVAVPNGNGELTGMLQMETLGVIGTPVCLTGTGSVGAVYDVLAGMRPHDGLPFLSPVVGETWDGDLGDAAGRHVRPEHVVAALEAARSGPVEEGSVGGGTSAICYGFKGGIGTASRRLSGSEDRPATGKWTVGALVQANHGTEAVLRIDGVPVGEELIRTGHGADASSPMPSPAPSPAEPPNSILIVLATDAPLLDYQLARLARRAVHGLAKTGAISRNSSGDFAVAFSTANRIPRRSFFGAGTYTSRSVEQFDINPLFEAAAEAVEEAIVNALFAAHDMVGRDDVEIRALPLAPTLALLDSHGRLFAPERPPAVESR